MDSKFLPCPYCKSKEIYVIESDNVEDAYGTKCIHEDGCELHDFHFRGWEANSEDAIKRWNEFAAQGVKTVITEIEENIKQKEKSISALGLSANPSDWKDMYKEELVCFGWREVRNYLVGWISHIS